MFLNNPNDKRLDEADDYEMRSQKIITRKKVRKIHKVSSISALRIQRFKF